MSAHDFKPGDDLPPLVKPAIDRVQLVKYAGASGDFNRIHYDDSFAQAGGFPTVIAHGMLSMAFLGQFVTHFIAASGTRGTLRRIQVRFKAVTFPGDVVTCHGEVTEVRDEGAERILELRIWSETQKAQVSVEGTASVAFPVEEKLRATSNPSAAGPAAS